MIRRLRRFTQIRSKKSSLVKSANLRNLWLKKSWSPGRPRILLSMFEPGEGAHDAGATAGFRFRLARCNLFRQLVFLLPVAQSHC